MVRAALLCLLWEMKHWCTCSLHKRLKGGLYLCFRTSTITIITIRQGFYSRCLFQLVISIMVSFNNVQQSRARTQTICAVGEPWRKFRQSKFRSRTDIIRLCTRIRVRQLISIIRWQGSHKTPSRMIVNRGLLSPNTTLIIINNSQLHYQRIITWQLSQQVSQEP